MTRTQDDRIELLIDQALREFPLEPVPGQLKASIMEQVEEPLSDLRYRISWTDFSFSAVLAVIFGFTLDILQSLVHSPYWNSRLRIAVILIWQETKYFLLHNQSSLLAALLSGGVLICLLAVLSSIYWRYTTFTNKQPI